MKITDELLQKYFDGKTTLEEEKAIKTAFATGQTEERHRTYLAMFQAFDRERRIELPACGAARKQTHRISFRLIRAMTLSAAACALLVLLVRLNAPASEYMIVHGKRMNDAQMAREFANAKIEKSLNVIKRNLASNNDNKILSEKLQEIEERLQTSTNNKK